jgi:RNA polymerase sigma-70 factor, ECF subfamily
MDYTSPTLLAKLNGPDRAAAWHRFVHLYTPLFHRWAERLAVPPADRLDLIQELFLRLLRALPQFTHTQGGSFRAWLHTLFVNKWRDQCRKRQPTPLGIGGSSFPAAAIEDPTIAVDEAEYLAVLVDRAARLIRADFNAATWSAFWATAVEDRPAREVAAEVGLTVNAVYLARARVLQRLRQELAGLLD